MSAIAKTVGKTAFGVVFGFDEDHAQIEADNLLTDVHESEQESIGAPVEKKNPLGYNLDYATAFYVTIQGVIGTGIFLSPASIVKSIGSVGASYVLWVAGFFLALFEVLVYIEYITYFPRRNGGDVAYLEQAFPRPAFLVPTTYAAITVILSFSTASAVAFGTYILNASGAKANSWTQRGIGVSALALCAILSGLSSKYSKRFTNLLGFVKIVTIFFIIFTGFAVFSGNTRVGSHSTVFKNAWEGTTKDGNAISNAIIKVSFSFGGLQYVIALAGESNPKKTKNLFRFFLPGILVFILILYLLIITSFYASFQNVKELKAAGTLVSAKFFQNVFESKAAVQALDVLIALAGLGHLNAVFLSHSRSLREIGRQGVVPYPKIWTSVKPFGTPLFPIAITFLVNLIILLAPPPGDAYNFIVDVGAYSVYFFRLLLFIGLIKTRRARKAAGLGFAGWKVPTPILFTTIAFYLFVIAMAWVPPKGTLIGSDVSFLYCAYAITTVGLILACLFYYYLWAIVFPKLGKYQHRTLYYMLANGEKGHTVVKVNTEDVAKWDTEHTADGKPLDLTNLDVDVSVEDVGIEISEKR